jgi:hypothetical protein
VRWQRILRSALAPLVCPERRRRAALTADCRHKAHKRAALDLAEPSATYDLAQACSTVCLCGCTKLNEVRR